MLRTDNFVPLSIFAFVFENKWQKSKGKKIIGA